jgi:hypothetical protein
MKKANWKAILKPIKQLSDKQLESYIVMATDEMKEWKDFLEEIDIEITRRKNQ